MIGPVQEIPLGRSLICSIASLCFLGDTAKSLSDNSRCFSSALGQSMLISLPA